MEDGSTAQLLFEAINELGRLTAEAAERCSNGDYLAAMASAAAIDPIKSLLLEQLGEAWSAAMFATPAGDGHEERSSATNGYL